ncbi:alpha/beta fold hydrolase [Pseudocitrobacter faecalis]|uniref:alpha/beta fold hydrolase n=1 Tax=Pseudocitrobacter faecalis TaxID=1398493 RepID=UPI003899D4C2
MKHFNSMIAGATVRFHDLPGQGIPVVFIHGLGCASSYEYPRIVADDAFRNRRALLIDLPGSGYSDKPADYSFTVSAQAQVVAELLTGLHIEACYLYGHSMGGSIAIEAAHLLGHRVRTLAVSEPNFYPGGGMFSRKIAAQTESEFIASGFAQLIAAETTPWKGCVQNTAPWALWRAAKSLVDGVSPDWMSRFLALRCEKALIYGAYSLPASDADEVAAAGIPLRIISDAGHCMSWENPSQLAKSLDAIFSETRNKHAMSVGV